MGREGKQKGDSLSGQLALSKGSARSHGQRVDIPSKGISYKRFLHALNILTIIANN
jgi:hypothetical protein